MSSARADHPGPGFGETPPDRGSSRRGGDPAARRERRSQAHREAVEADPDGVARELCLASLSQTARTRSQLAALLARREIPDEAATRVLDRLTQVGLVDDEQYATSYVAGRAHGQARRALRHGLTRAGVEAEVAELAVGEVSDEAERAAAEQLVQRRLRSMSGLAEPVKVRRLVGMLARKGYAPGLCYEVVRSQCRDADLALADDDFQGSG